MVVDFQGLYIYNIRIYYIPRYVVQNFSLGGSIRSLKCVFPWKFVDAQKTREPHQIFRRGNPNERLDPKNDGLVWFGLEFSGFNDFSGVSWVVFVSFRGM